MRLVLSSYDVLLIRARLIPTRIKTEDNFSPISNVYIVQPVPGNYLFGRCLIAARNRSLSNIYVNIPRYVDTVIYPSIENICIYSEHYTRQYVTYGYTLRNVVRKHE